MTVRLIGNEESFEVRYTSANEPTFVDNAAKLIRCDLFRPARRPWPLRGPAGYRAGLTCDYLLGRPIRVSNLVAAAFGTASCLMIRMRSLSGGGAVSVPRQGQISVNLCIPLSSLLITCAYVRTIERRREIFILCSESGMRITVSEEQRTASGSLRTPSESTLAPGSFERD